MDWRLRSFTIFEIYDVYVIIPWKSAILGWRSISLISSRYRHLFLSLNAILSCTYSKGMLKRSNTIMPFWSILTFYFRILLKILPYCIIKHWYFARYLTIWYDFVWGISFSSNQNIRLFLPKTGFKNIVSRSRTTLWSIIKLINKGYHWVIKRSNTLDIFLTMWNLI